MCYRGVTEWLAKCPDPARYHSAINPATEEEICKVVAGLSSCILKNSRELIVNILQHLKKTSMLP